MAGEHGGYGGGQWEGCEPEEGDGERWGACRGKRGLGWGCLTRERSAWPWGTSWCRALPTVPSSRVVADDLEAALHLTAPSYPTPGGRRRRNPGCRWSHSKEHLQASLAELERRLRQHGLEINPTKTAIIHSCRGRHLYHRGKAVACRPFGEVITALGSPITFGEQVAAIVTEMNHRARRAFRKHAHLLCAPTALEERIRLHQTLVRGAAMWGAESWQKYGSHVQGGQQHADGTGPQNDAPRAPTGGELGGLERTHAARACSLPRWSTYTLERMWDMYGHMARAEQGGRPMLSWKNLQWWRREQSKPRSQRHTHAGQFNPIVDPERQLTKVAGDAWQEVARNTTVWGALRGEFLQQFDVPWSTGKQSSLENLVPNLTTTSGRSSTMRMIQTR